MVALLLREVKSPFVVEERPPLVPQPGEVVVALKASSLNRRDYWITQGMYPGIKLPVVLGSDGAGIVRDVGDDVDLDWAGAEVVVNPGLDWGESPRAQSSSFHILGMPRDGTFASEVCVPVSQLHRKPAHLDWTQSAALPLAGVTAWRAMVTQGGLQPDDTLLITGIGGGVATFALQFAVGMGAKVWVTSSSQEKIDQAVRLGAAGGFNYREATWTDDLIAAGGAPTLVVDSAGGAGYRSLLEVVAPGGRIVNYGATTGAPEKVDLFKVFWKQLTLRGSTMGSPEDFAAMLQFIEEQQIEPVIDSVSPLFDANDAIAQMASSGQFGKLVLDHEPVG